MSDAYESSIWFLSHLILPISIGSLASRIGCLAITHACSGEHAFKQLRVNCLHAMYSSNVPTSTSSVVRQLARVSLTWDRRKHKRRLATIRCFYLSDSSCSIVSSSLTADDLIRCWVAANACSAEPCRCLAFTALSASQCVSGHYLSCHEPSRVSEPSEPCVLIDGSSSCLSSYVQLNLLSFHHIRVNTACSRCCRHPSAGIVQMLT